MLTLKQGAYIETIARCGHTIADVTRNEMPLQGVLAALEAWQKEECDECYDDTNGEQYFSDEPEGAS